jgi:hypothetical protein
MNRPGSSSVISSPIRHSHDLVHLNSKLRSLIQQSSNIKQKDEEYDDEVPAFVEIEEELSQVLTAPMEGGGHQSKISEEEEVLRKSSKIR